MVSMRAGSFGIGTSLALAVAPPVRSKQGHFRRSDNEAELATAQPFLYEQY